MAGSNFPHKVRRGTTAQWTAANPVLRDGEQGFDTTLKVLKTGDGVTAWSSLSEVGSGTYAPLGKDGIGNRASVFGDSLANNGQGLLYYLAAISKQQFWISSSTYVKSNPGYSSASLVPVVSQITSLSPLPNVCMVTAGSNDCAGGIPLSQFITNMTAIFSALLAKGITPIVCTVPPRSGVSSLNRQYNNWLKRYAATYRLPLIDWYATLVDPASATGQYLSAYDSGDGTHPNAAGTIAVATDAASRLSALMLPAPDLVSHAPGGLNLYPSSTFTVDSNADGISEYLSATPSAGFAYSRVADASGWYWQRITLSSAGGTKRILSTTPTVATSAVTTTLAASFIAGASSISTVASLPNGLYIHTTANGDQQVLKVSGVSGSGPYTETLNVAYTPALAGTTGDTISPAVLPGDTLAFSAKVRNGQASANFVVELTCYDAGQAHVTGNLIITTPNVVTGFTQRITDGVCYGEIVVPAATEILQWDITVGATDGTYDVALPTIINLSRPAVQS